jgi:hypothetical protein
MAGPMRFQRSLPLQMSFDRFVRNSAGHEKAGKIPVVIE